MDLNHKYDCPLLTEVTVSKNHQAFVYTCGCGWFLVLNAKDEVPYVNLSHYFPPEK